MKKIHVKPGYYAAMFEKLKDIARRHGYNLCIHGSLNRDMDLVAIPWADGIPSSHEKSMVEMMVSYIGGYLHDSETGRMPGGRMAYVININRQLDKDGNDLQYYLDLSVVPSAAMVG